MSENNSNGKNDIVTFFVGLAMIIVGGYFFLQNVSVMDSSNLFAFYIGSKRMDGLVFVPLIASIIFLFYKYNTVSKLCCAGSMLFIIGNVISNLKLHWTTISLFSTVVIFVLLFGGIGLVCRTLFANPDGKHGKHYD